MGLHSRFLGFLKQGLSPHQLALAVALGCAISVIPMLGTTTILCALAAWGFGLNQPAVQSINWLLYPLQFILLIPWYKLGAALFFAPPVHWTGQEVRQLIQSGWLQAISVLWTVTWHAVVAWGLAAPIIIAVIYWPLRMTFQTMRSSLPRSA